MLCDQPQKTRLPGNVWLGALLMASVLRICKYREDFLEAMMAIGALAVWVRGIVSV